MLPTPTTSRWSMSATLSAVRRPESAPSSALPSKPGSSGSRPRWPSQRWAVRPAVSHRSSMPKRRGSTKRRTVPSSKLSVTCSCGPRASPSNSSRPDMPRWSRSVRSGSSSPRMYLARRPNPAIRRPTSDASRPAGSGKRMSARRCTTPVTRRPVSRARKARTVVSTSGSSGNSVPHRRPARLLRTGPASTSRRHDGTDRPIWMSERDPARAPGTDPAERLARSFGYAEVDPAAKAGLVRGVFDRVAGRYDLMNDLMSAGVHRLWKEALLDWLAPRPGMRLLDVAGGTGDIALRLLERGGGGGGGTPPPPPLAGGGGGAGPPPLNTTPPMRGGAGERAGARGGPARGGGVTGAGGPLPFPDRHFEAYTIAFGIRNVTHID